MIADDHACMPRPAVSQLRATRAGTPDANRFVRRRERMESSVDNRRCEGPTSLSRYVAIKEHRDPTRSAPARGGLATRTSGRASHTGCPACTDRTCPTRKAPVITEDQQELRRVVRQHFVESLGQWRCGGTELARAVVRGAHGQGLRGAASVVRECALAPAAGMPTRGRTRRALRIRARAAAGFPAEASRGLPSA